MAKKRRSAFVAPDPPPSLIPATQITNRTKSIAAISNLLDADPQFYVHVEQVSLEKLRRDAMETRALSREAHPMAIQQDLKKSTSHRGDVRWRTLVRLSYQKAKFCARLLRVCPKESRRATAAILPNNLQALGISATPLRCSSVVELSVTAENKEEKQQKRGRSRSDAFILPNNAWRPNVAALLSNSAPAATPSAVSCAAEWMPTSHVLAA